VVRWLVFACALMLGASAYAADDAGARYQALVAAARQGGAPVDWQALRFAYADSPGFDVFGARSAGLRKAMFESFQKADFAGAAAQAEQLLEDSYVEIDAHIVCDLAYQRLGDAARARRHHDSVTGLLASIRTGDGRTPATAFTVITVREEYGVLHAFGIKPTHQSLIQDGGHAYDLLEGVDPAGQPQRYYFLIDRVMAAEAAALKNKPKP